MELIPQIFIHVKLAVVGTLLYSVYRLYLTKFKSTFWRIMVIIGLLLLVIAPIKT